MTGRYRVTVAIEGQQMLRGWWQDESVARRKFTGWVGEHGVRPHARIILTDEETGATLTQWPDTESYRLAHTTAQAEQAQAS